MGSEPPPEWASKMEVLFESLKADEGRLFQAGKIFFHDCEGRQKHFDSGRLVVLSLCCYS
ncbi:hypothetical protein CASFOL_039433 [Castilleja foliolosa]|uniref:Uncharacterized protein n=1 Tax=Castilleja foliolosa TaxID=1961234 RepID=A0ABD3BIH0_9LAMI